MPDGWERERQQPVAVGPPRHRMSRAARIRESRRRRRRRLVRGVTLSAFIMVVIAAVFLGSRMWHSVFNGGGDYSGDGKADIVIQIHDGDSTTAIGQTLEEHHVVATSRAFINAAEGDSGIQSIQPGFYRMRTEIPAADAVARLTDAHNRVGKLVIPEGRQLDDIRDVKTNNVTEGIFSLISNATCVDLDGDRRCMSADLLREAAGSAPLAALSVPEWATQPVQAMGDDHRRLEGLIAPGSWDVDPSASAIDILSTLINASAIQYTQSGLLDTAKSLNMSPYQILTVASLVQRESKPQDFDKVARVIYNRLVVPDHRRLEFDSTVNYSLDRQEVATTDADRAKTTPWNTYVREGLPATPICSPGTEALTAAERPANGDWLYFVTVDLQGTTLFTRDYPQHLANIELAKRNGVLDSAR
ncbi:endolytic transglycosylase MltG [Mycobacterium sp. 1274761.0]|uniref:endolytic transglycosylase MltG n=1 Tax=Mycobacterium sp. 1274761.0 TaxID=1834077 RepID=UPI0008022A29|nr:endolytic transglycosylase MltG [Mycobacterium sp. 1274761.0]OBK78199.1 aminodeoxychorismate lyase [Mycobacterium sp. 1274761.0]